MPKSQTANVFRSSILTADHSNPRALGLGSGTYEIRANGIDLPFELERIVSDNGMRPFNRAELQRIERVNVCASCHQYMKAPLFWKRLENAVGRAPDNESHNKVLGTMLKSTPRQ